MKLKILPVQAKRTQRAQSQLLCNVHKRNTARFLHLLSDPRTANRFVQFANNRTTKTTTPRRDGALEKPLAYCLGAAGPSIGAASGAAAGSLIARSSSSKTRTELAGIAG